MFFQLSWELVKLCVYLATWLFMVCLLVTLTVAGAGVSLMLNCITIPVYVIYYIVTVVKKTAKPRVGYAGLTIYPTREDVYGTSTLKEFLFRLLAFVLFIVSIFLLIVGEWIPGIIGAVIAVVLWRVFTPKHEREFIKEPFKKLSNHHQPRTGIEFEEYCGAYLLKHGFHDVHLTPPSGDYGADIIAKDANGVTWVFQCKRYNSKVGNGCVQEVVAAKKHYGASKAAVMTNSRLTQKARELAIENEVILFECMN